MTQSEKHQIWLYESAEDKRKKYTCGSCGFLKKEEDEAMNRFYGSTQFYCGKDDSSDVKKDSPACAGYYPK